MSNCKIWFLLRLRPKLIKITKAKSHCDISKPLKVIHLYATLVLERKNVFTHVKNLSLPKFQNKDSAHITIHLLFRQKTYDLQQ